MSDTLVLNADGMPVSWMPLSTCPWEESIRYLVLDKADVLLWHDNWIVRSARWSTPVPSVIMLRDYMKPKHSVRFSRANIYLRDNGICAYCESPVERNKATLDHIHPVSKGGKSTWENCVTACGPCNSNKSDSVKGWKPKFKPYKPDYFELVNKRKKQDLHVRYKEWLQFLT